MNKTLLTFTILLVYITNAKSQNFKTPNYLKEGDTIAILAPAGILKPYRKASILKAKKLAESWGLHVVFGKNMFNQEHHFAGTDEQRFNDFQKALDDKSIKAIWAARGGYGSVRIIDKLDFSKFKKKPKWIIGYSDITAFHNHINNIGIETIHGIMATSLAFDKLQNRKSINSLYNALFGKILTYKIPFSKKNRILEKKQIKGQLIGGNLAIVSSMLGSKSQLDTKNKILFIEEIGEYKYAIDRMLQSLKRAGYFKEVNAVIIGNISNIKKNNSISWGSTIEQLIVNAIPKNIPVFFNFPAGHEVDNRAMIFGRKVLLELENNNYLVKFED